MQIPVLDGIAATETAEFVQTLPVNLEPIGLTNGISQGQLRLAPGARTTGAGPGIGRGAIVFNGKHYRVMGTKLVNVAVDGTVTTIGDVGGAGPVGLTYGFGRLAIQSGTTLYYYDGTTLTQVTDTDLGSCLDVAWLDSQYFTTDGTDILAADITDPTSFTGTRYGSAEADPDAITGILPLRNEMYVFGTNTIEVQDYAGTSNFPLSSVPGATILKGCVTARAKVRYSQSFAFVGNGRNETPGVYLADGASALKLSTRLVDKLLAAVQDVSKIELEVRSSDDEERLFVHLPTMTLVYLFAASKAAQKQVWYVLQSGVGMTKPYRPRHAVLFNGQWWVDDTETAAIGVLDETIGSHFGETFGWSFSTTLLYNKGKSAILHQHELVGLFGRGVVLSSTVFWSYSLDGETWSIERANKMPAQGVRNKRIVWSPHRRFRNYMAMRYRGDGNCLVGIAAINIDDKDGIEALAA